MNKIIILNRRIVYRGDVYNAIEGERINTLFGVLNDRYMDGIHDGLKRALVILANDVKDIPTSDVAEVRHGKLLDAHPYGRCSLCGFLIDVRDSFKYCPNCGAKMDGGADDDS